MISILLTITLIIGIVLIMLLLFVLGKLNWLENATTLLISKLEKTTDNNVAKNLVLDPYFYGLNGQTLWQCLIGEDKTQATELELDEIRSRYSIVILKALISFIKDGVDLEHGKSLKTSTNHFEKTLLTSRGSVNIWLPPSKGEALKTIGSKITEYLGKENTDGINKSTTITFEALRDEILTIVYDLSEMLGLRHGSDMGEDIMKEFLLQPEDLAEQLTEFE
jgi:hypothetical protein